METIPEILLTNQIHRLNKGRYIFYDGTLDGEPCYCMIDNKNARKVIFDKSDAVLEEIKRIGGMRCRSLRNDAYSVVVDEGEIKLRAYLSKKYIGNDAWQNIQRTHIEDERLAAYDILDLRSNNIGYYTKKERAVSILHRPTDPDEKYISLTFGGITEVFDYTPKTYDYLTDDSLSLSIREKTRSNPGRLRIVKPSRSLSKVVYELLNGSLADDYDCSHIHSGYRWLNSVYNLMPMKGTTNDSMLDFASQIGGGAKMNAIVWNYPYGNYKILVELRLMKLLPIYLLCDTPEQYADLQKHIMGRKKLTERLRLFWKGDEVNTPKAEYTKTKMKYNHSEDQIKHLWDWCDTRDRILSMYTNAPDYFIPWTGDINDVFRAMIRRGWIKMVGICRI